MPDLRVLLVEIGEEKKFCMESKVFAIPKKVMLGSGEGLFDHIANCLHEFIAENKLADRKLPLGFTFSFPCKQEGLAKVIIIISTVKHAKIVLFYGLFALIVGNYGSRTKKKYR